MIEYTNKKGITTMTLILIIVGILLAGCIAMGAIIINSNNSNKNNLNKSDNSTTNIVEQQNNKEESNNSNKIEKAKVAICDEYYDTTNPIPVKKDNKYGYIDNKGNLIIDYQYQRGYDFNGQYAIVQDIDNSYYLIDRTGKKVMDIPSKLNPYSNKYENEVELDYLKYGVYYFYNTREAYDFNLKKIENFDNQIYSDMKNKSYDDDYSSLKLLNKYDYAFENKSLLYKNEQIMTLDYADKIDVPKFDELNYYIEKENIFPVVISGIEKAEIIDLISKNKIASTTDISGFHRGYFSLYGRFAVFNAPMMDGISKIYSFYNNQFIDVDSEFGRATFRKTYYILENGGTIGEDSTKYIYYNSNGEKIYETSEEPITY